MIYSKLPTELKTLISDLLEAGFEICLLGGIIRDFFLNHKIGNDFDFEIRQKGADSRTSNGELNLLKNWLEVHKFNFAELPYGILQIHFEDFQIEFAPPRKENFLKDIRSHHNFTAMFSDNFSYLESFSRRDFSVNSIGIQFKIEDHQVVETLIDPFNGMEDLDQKILKSLSDDFFCDPVRLLRLIRFEIKLEFKVHGDLVSKLGQFNLEDLSWFHFVREVQKVDIGKFLNKLSSYKKAHNIKVSSALEELLDLEFPLNKLSSFDELLAYVSLKKFNLACALAQKVGASYKILESFKLFLNSLEYVEALDNDFFKSFLELDFEHKISHPVLLNFKVLLDNPNLFQYASLTGKVYHLHGISLVAFSSFKLPPDELSVIEPKMRSLYIVYRFLISRYSNL